MSRPTEEWIRREGEAILEKFNFQAVADFMRALDWTWFDSKEPPTPDRIKDSAIGLLDGLIRERAKNYSSGGLTWYLDSESRTMGLSFSLEEEAYWSPFGDEEVEEPCAAKRGEEASHEPQRD